MRIVFMGTPEFAVPSLTTLHEAGHEIVGVFTQPDKPVGRKQVLTPPPVKVEAQRLNLKVFQPETFKNRACEPLLQELAPELITVVAYGKILPRHVLELPKYGCVNLHGSLLPKYRGADPIQWSVINGDEETGVTTMFLAPGI
ncbi:MAG: methionyl-tRNA formyltransferase, partial [Clostridia bacterium]|nr:methionyl-tRNA formyltransferase [Clostridia bacterium]